MLNASQDSRPQLELRRNIHPKHLRPLTSTQLGVKTIQTPSGWPAQNLLCKHTLQSMVLTIVPDIICEVPSTFQWQSSPLNLKDKATFLTTDDDFRMVLPLLSDLIGH